MDEEDELTHLGICDLYLILLAAAGLGIGWAMILSG